MVDAVQEYRGGLISVGDSYLNCTDHDINVTRSVTFQPTITDNIGGTLSGTSTKTGTVTNTSQVSLSGTATGTETIRNSSETYSPNFGKAVEQNTNTSTTSGELSGTLSGYSEGTKTAEKSFEDSASRNYSRTWDNSVQNETSISPTVPAGDVLTVGYVGMGNRVTGTLQAVGTSKYVKNVVVDEPSFMESSAFVAQTYTAPKGSCIQNRPTGRAAQLFKLLRDVHSQTPQSAFPPGRE